MSRALSRRGLLRGLGALAATAAIGVTTTASPAGHAASLRLGDTITDPWEVRFLRIWRRLDEGQRAAWMRMLERVGAGMPVREAGYRFHRELGFPAREARDRTDASLREARGT